MTGHLGHVNAAVYTIYTI